jgi:hypothetical protein
METAQWGPSYKERQRVLDKYREGERGADNCEDLESLGVKTMGQVRNSP